MCSSDLLARKLHQQTLLGQYLDPIADKLLLSTLFLVLSVLHRIERIELDLPDGSLPSLSQRFSAKTGLDPAALLGSAGANGKLGRNTGSRSAVHSTEGPA